MSPDDARHGTRAGYIAGCREECCGLPHYRYQKRSRLRLLREGSQIVPATPTLERIAWWGQRGVSLNALTEAAGIGYGTLAEMAAGQRDVCLRSTERATLAVTWDTLPGKALCLSGMTHRRIYSMMASGHTLAWISAQVGDGLPISGRWRAQDRVRVSLARAVADVARNAPGAGPSRHVSVKARNRGHMPIAAWDDPGDPAMPASWRPAQGRRTSTEEPDPEVIARLAAGRRIDSIKAEKVEALRIWLDRGGSEREFCLIHGLKAGRYKTTEDAA